MNAIRLLAQEISGGIVHCVGAPCTLCDLSILADRSTRFLLFNVMLPIAALMILIGGILLLTARGNQQQQTQGKAVLTYAVWGMIIAFAAWLIITTLLATLGYKATWYAFPDPSSCVAATGGTNGGGGGGNEAYCIFNGQARCTNVGSCDVCTGEGGGCTAAKPSECGGSGGNEAYCIFGGRARCTNVGECRVCTNEGAEGCATTRPSTCN